MSDGKDPLRYFRVEAKEIADELGRHVLLFEKAPSRETVARLLRLAHTLKGAAGVVKQRTIAERAHALEDALALHRDGSEAVPREAINATVAHIDAIAALVADLSKPADAKRRGAEEPGAAVHAEPAEMDALLNGIAEAGVRMRALRSTADLTLRTRRLAERLVERAALLPASARAAGASVAALAAEIRSSAIALERDFAGGLDLAEREIQQVRAAAERLRLVPCSVMLTTLERAARDIAQSSGKQIVFEAHGGDVRIDAQVLFVVQRALVQLVRNAVAHGIEMPGVRTSAGKPSAGRVVLEIARRGNRVAFVCHDDGAGVDLKAVRDAARARGLPARSIDTASADELLQMLFLGGLSTAPSVTEHSGRGVGLDVVRDAAAQLGGQVGASSDPGQGTRIEIAVPVSLSAVEALLVECDGAAHAIPLSMVRGTLRLSPSEIARTAQGSSIVRNGEVIPLVSLSHMLRRERKPPPTATGAAVVVAGSKATLALQVTTLKGAEDVVVRPLPALAFADPLAAGISLDSEGVPRLLLDADGLIAAAMRLAGNPLVAEAPVRAPILVIDDSLTTRVLEQSILESAGYDVDLAISAEEGLQKAQARRYGLFLVDVEMPGMDGFTFVETIRADPALRDIPAILVTSRNAEEDKERGRKAGANGYVVKGEFDQNRVLASIRELMGLA